jgi:hypothetical protein
MSRPPGRQKHATHWHLKPKDSACHPQNRWSGRCHSEPAKAQWRESLPEEWEWDGCGKKEADWVTEPTRTDLLGIVPAAQPSHARSREHPVDVAETVRGPAWWCRQTCIENVVKMLLKQEYAAKMADKREFHQWLSIMCKEQLYRVYRVYCIH